MKQDYSTTSIDNLLYACALKTQRSMEHFVESHVLGYLLSGEMQFTTVAGTRTLKAGTLMLARRNQLVKAIKGPGADAEFRSVNIFLDQKTLMEYAAAHQLESSGMSTAEALFELPSDAFIEGYFRSLLPYFEMPERMTTALTALKTREVLELVLAIEPGLKDVLFDFSEPHKMDLQSVMLQHYKFNVPMETFARLAGRSLASFKRDFMKVFKTSPGQWLKQKRLEEAYRLIRYKGVKPSEAYLDVGFENLSHFSYVFKQTFGVNPSAV